MLDTNKKYVESKVYQDILDSLGTGVIYYDQNGVLYHANKTAHKILPDLEQSLSTLHEFIGFAYETSLESHEQNGLIALSQCLQDSFSFLEIIQLDNRQYYAVRILTQDDRTTIVELSDISHIKLKIDDVKLLDKGNKILAEAMHTSQKGIFIAENINDRPIVFISQHMNHILGVDNHCLVGESVDIFLSEVFPDEWYNIQDAITNSISGRFWRRIDKKDGDVQWLRLNLSADKSCGDGKLIIGFISDETQSKLQENHLLQNQKLEAIGKLAGGVAHDFNNILSIVDGYIRLSETALKRGENITENMSRIKQAVARGSGLTKQLLAFGKHRMNHNVTLNMITEMQTIEGFLKPLLGANVGLEIDYPKECSIFVNASSDSLSQIIMNLVINARDAIEDRGEDGGKIRIELHQRQNGHKAHAILKVIDNGFGMSPKIIEKIFDPFFTTKDQGRGTGLGLSMVYGIIQQLGGHIGVTSVERQGTTFTVEIPMVEAPAFNENQDKSVETLSDLTGKTILIAEDEDHLLDIMKSTLNEFNMNVLTARNGNEALIVQDEYEGKIDFLLTDMVMPELGGLKLAALIKEVRPETHILFMSGYPVRGDISQIDLPEDAIFMAKPVNHNILRNILEQISSQQPLTPSQITTWTS